MLHMHVSVVCDTVLQIISACAQAPPGAAGTAHKRCRWQFCIWKQASSKLIHINVAFSIRWV